MSADSTWRTPGLRPISALLPAALSGVLRACSNASKPSSDAGSKRIVVSSDSVPAGVLMALQGLIDTGVPGRQNAYQGAVGLPSFESSKAPFRPVEPRNPSKGLR